MADGGASFTRFDPRRTAYYEAALWQAYYAHAWGRALFLLYRLLRTQFLLGPGSAVVATIWGIAAALVFVPIEHDDEAVRRHLQRFYAVVRRATGAHYSVSAAGLAEFAYWDVHRAQSGSPEREEVIAALAAVAATVNGLPVPATYPSARERDRAVALVDEITGHRRPSTPEAWQEIEDTLYRSYALLTDVLAAR